jgi:hypothetical protein
MCALGQVSLKSSACPGRQGKGLKKSDFKFSRNTYYVTSREAPGIIWIEKFKPSDHAVRCYVVRDKTELDDQNFLDHGDLFDTYLMRWEAKTLDIAFKQVPIVTKEVGNAFPHILEVQDLYESTEKSAAFMEFTKTGEQVCDRIEPSPCTLQVPSLLSHHLH